MNPPDLKPSMNPNPNLKFHDLRCGFVASTGEPGNWRSLMTLVGWRSRSTIPTGNRTTRSFWLSLVFTRGTIRLKNPGSGIPDYQVELGGSDVFGLCNSDSVSRWSHRRTRPPWLWLLPRMRLWLPLYWTTLPGCTHVPDNPPSRRWWCGSASQPPTLEPLALAIS
jgi:hypothetical protein